MSVRSTSAAGVGPPSVCHTPISNQTTRAAKANQQAEAERSEPTSQSRNRELTASAPWSRRCDDFDIRYAHPCDARCRDAAVVITVSAIRSINGLR
jgi:hypothetical protein